MSLEVTGGHRVKWRLKIKNEKKSTLWVLMERSSIVEFKYLKIFVIRGHKRSLEVNKGQMEVKNQNVRKINNMGIDGKVFNCRIQLFEHFCH